MKINHNSRLYFICLLIACMLFSALFSSCARKEETNEKQRLADFTPISLGSSVIVADFFSYSGQFVEDGSDEEVNDIVAVTVENKGEESIQLLSFSLVSDKGDTYEFELTTLLPHEKIIVLEKNRASFDMRAAIADSSVERFVPFSEKPSINSETIMLIDQENSIAVRNLSDKAISSGNIFFKIFDGEKYIGGITYMVRFTSIGPGEEVQAYSAHFNPETCKVMFVSYVE